MLRPHPLPAATQPSPSPTLYIEDREQFESLPAFDCGAISRMAPPLQQGIALVFHPSTFAEGNWGFDFSFGVDTRGAPLH